MHISDLAADYSAILIHGLPDVYVSGLYSSFTQSAEELDSMLPLHLLSG